MMFTLAAGKALAIATVAGLSGLAIITGLPRESITLPGSGAFTHGTFGGAAISIGRYEVTWREWKACYDDGGCSFLPKPGLKSTAGDFPVTGVNRFDVGEFIHWVNTRTGKAYRLPTADEWNGISGGLSRRKTKKLFDDPRLAWAADYGAMEQVSAKVQPSGSFGTASNGVFDLGGNVWEWTATCSTQGASDRDCPAYLAEGLHEADVSVFIRDPASGGCAVGTPPANIGFRLVSDD